MPRRPTRASPAPDAHVLVYDGGCPFCTATASWLRRHAQVPVRLMTFEEVARSGVLTELSRPEVEAAAHLITPEGIEYHGGEAVTRSLRLLRFGWPAGVLDAPGLRYERDAGYAVVTRLRPWPV